MEGGGGNAWWADCGAKERKVLRCFEFLLRTSERFVPAINHLMGGRKVCVGVSLLEGLKASRV